MSVGVAMVVCFDNVRIHGDDFRSQCSISQQCEFQCTFKPIFAHINENISLVASCESNRFATCSRSPDTVFCLGNY